MLVLARRIGQQIVLPGYGVTIDIVGLTKSQVRIGIEAPPTSRWVAEKFWIALIVGAKASRRGERPMGRSNL